MGLTLRIIPCLDVREGRVVKGLRFRDLRDCGDPEALAARYEAEGADEIALLDVAATPVGRGTQVSVVEAVGRAISIPLMAGGGVRTLPDMERLLEAGADKVALNTAAWERPAFLEEAARAFGSQFVVISVDAALGPEGWTVTTHGGRVRTERGALDWAVEAVARGAGEVLLNALSADGTQAGFACELTAAVSGRVGVPVIASGGAGSPEDFLRAFRQGRADAALAASIFHDGLWTVRQVKEALASAGMELRPC